MFFGILKAKFSCKQQQKTPHKQHEYKQKHRYKPHSSQIFRDKKKIFLNSLTF